MKRRRKITFETEKIVIRGELPLMNWCEACAASTPKVTAEQAAMLMGEETRQLYRRAECGQVHATKGPGGVLMICLKTLSAVPRSEWELQLNADPRRPRLRSAALVQAIRDALISRKE